METVMSPCVEMPSERISAQHVSPRRMPAELQTQTETILRDLAYVYHLTRDVKQAITRGAKG